MVNDYLKYCFYLYLKMDNSEGSNSEVSSQRREMKGPSFSFDPKLFLKEKNSKTEQPTEDNCCDNKDCSNKVNKDQEKKVEKEDLNPREKLRQKLQMHKMMRQNKGSLKRMLDSKIKS